MSAQPDRQYNESSDPFPPRRAAVPPRTPVQMGGYSKKVKRRRESKSSSIAAQVVLFTVVMGGTAYANMLRLNVRLESARLRQIQAVSRTKYAKRAEAKLRAELDLLVSRDNVDQWARDRQFTKDAGVPKAKSTRPELPGGLLALNQ